MKTFINSFCQMSGFSDENIHNLFGSHIKLTSATSSQTTDLKCMTSKVLYLGNYRHDESLASAKLEGLKLHA